MVGKGRGPFISRGIVISGYVSKAAMTEAGEVFNRLADSVQIISGHHLVTATRMENIDQGYRDLASSEEITDVRPTFTDHQDACQMVFKAADYRWIGKVFDHLDNGLAIMLIKLVENAV